MDDAAPAGRPASGMRGRATRRGANAPASSKDAGAAAADADAGDEPQDEGEPASWKVELESIMAGTHPALVEALEPHDAKMKAIVSQADRVRQLQMVNINALFDCEKKQADDENKAQLEFFKARLIDTIEEKQKKAAAAQAGARGRGADAKGKPTGDKRKRGEAAEPEKAGCLPASYVLKPDELKADLDEINTNVDHYSVRTAAAASDEARSSATADAWFDRSRQLLHCNGQSLERGTSVVVHQQGQGRVDDTWTLTAMNAVEVTLRDAEGTKLKVTLAQLRNGRYTFKPL